MQQKIISWPEIHLFSVPDHLLDIAFRRSEVQDNKILQTIEQQKDLVLELLHISPDRSQAQRLSKSLPVRFQRKSTLEIRFQNVIKMIQFLKGQLLMLLMPPYKT